MEERLQAFALGQSANIDQPAMGPPFFKVDYLLVDVELGSKWEINTGQPGELTSVESGLFSGNPNNAIDARKEDPFQPALPKVARLDSGTLRLFPRKIGVIIVCFVESAHPIAVAAPKPGQAR